MNNNKYPNPQLNNEVQMCKDIIYSNRVKEVKRIFEESWREMDIYRRGSYMEMLDKLVEPKEGKDQIKRFVTHVKKEKKLADRSRSNNMETKSENLHREREVIFYKL